MSHPVFRLQYPLTLPISALRDDIIATLRSNRVTMIAGETGSGKTTQLPKLCIEAGLGSQGKIGCTQPRRIAALSVSRRIAEELGVEWGEEVGCKIRFSDRTKEHTTVKVMTDGILLAEMRSDPLLRAYQTLIIDEAHERSLNIDLLIGYLRVLLSRRQDLSVVITSATINTALFAEAFDGAPIIEVSGRSYPVEIRYQTTSTSDESSSDGDSYIDSAVAAVEGITEESIEGDVLIFMPSERDIRETCDQLTGRYGSHYEIMPLMGSLSAVEQERVFRSSPRRKLIVATNIAETSLTIPNIRYVVDTGLARVSRYNPRSRTKHLPIERIAKSSAAQRAGRAGRVREGVCIRLFSEEEFDSRPDYPDPEIKRSNLAEVILRMSELNLGDIENFPFIDPPEPRAVRNGYQILQELGALDKSRKLTRLGRSLARLPVDPTVGRMLLESCKENCLADVLVIAAGLSIQDPRERPLVKRERADEAHRKFMHPDSDFLTLLNIWHEYRGTGLAEGKSRSQMRQFCKANFLSFMRMREWADIHAELEKAVKLGSFSKDTPEHSPPTAPSEPIKRFDGRYRAIHRSILCGLLSHVAVRIGRNTYRGTSGRELALFPGSSLSERRGNNPDLTDKKKRRRRHPSKEQWIVMGEIIETSRTYARLAAFVTPAWIVELGAALCKRVVEDPFWDSEQQSVSARERITLSGLLLADRRISYGRVDPVEARELFVLHALVPDDSPLPYTFIRENRRLRDKLVSLLARSGRSKAQSIDENLANFYCQKLPYISSANELHRLLRRDRKLEESDLSATEQDLLGTEYLPAEVAECPDKLLIADTPIAVHYRYEPGGERDGATLAVPLELARQLPPRMLDGAIPGLQEQQVLSILWDLPKEYRNKLTPSVKDAAKAILLDPDFSKLPLLDGIVEKLRKYWSVELTPHDLKFDQRPTHLRPRIEVIDRGEVVASGRDLAHLQRTLPDSSDPLPPWTRARSSWERDEIRDLEFGELPDQIEITQIADVPLYAYPALCAEETKVALRLVESRETAVRQSTEGEDLLLRTFLRKELQELRKQAQAVERLKPLITLFLTLDQLKDFVIDAAFKEMVARERHYPPCSADLHRAAERAQGRMPGLVAKIITLAESILSVRREVVSAKHSYTGIKDDLARLAPPDFLVRTPLEQLQHLPRYLRAMLIRAEQAENDPRADAVRAAQVAPYRLIAERLPEGRANPVWWMVEELRVSLFAQKLGTAYPISATRIDKVMGKGR